MSNLSEYYNRNVFLSEHERDLLFEKDKNLKKYYDEFSDLRDRIIEYDKKKKNCIIQSEFFIDLRFDGISHLRETAIYNIIGSNRTYTPTINFLILGENELKFSIKMALLKSDDIFIDMNPYYITDYIKRKEKINSLTRAIYEKILKEMLAMEKWEEHKKTIIEKKNHIENSLNFSCEVSHEGGRYITEISDPDMNKLYIQSNDGENFEIYRIKCSIPELNKIIDFLKKEKIKCQ